MPEYTDNEKIIKISRKALEEDPSLCARLRKADAVFYDSDTEIRFDRFIDSYATAHGIVIGQSKKRKMIKRMLKADTPDDLALINIIESMM